jgi:tRNA pseudouridine13 synthase
MKIKQRPEDFVVEELTDVVPGSDGPFALYRLEKRGWTTHDALQAIRRRWKLEARRLSYGGLKDRHAHTVQYFTIFHGRERKLTHHGVSVTYLGRVARAYTSQDIRANRFRLALRDLTPDRCASAQSALEDVQRQGVPNYFDDQRFGSVSGHGGFVARAMVAGQFEEALRLALAAPYEHDRAAQKEEKAILQAHWGDWAACKDKLPRGHARSLIDYLTHHPGDFRGALARLRPELRSLYLSAYQSHLWNRMLALWLSEHCTPDQLISVKLRLGQVPMHRRLREDQLGELSALQLPLPSPRTRLEESDARAILVKSILAEDGLELDQLKLKGLREMFFSKGQRAALCLPAGIEHESAADELNSRKEKLTIAFDLPRGSYATLVVKRVTL